MICEKEIVIKNEKNTASSEVKFLAKINTIYIKYFKTCGLYEIMKSAEVVDKIRQQTNSDSIIFDNLDFEGYDEASCQWSMRNYVPMLIENGVKNIAFLLPSNKLINFEYIQTLDLLSKYFNVKTFYNFDSAYTWLSKIKNENAL